MIEGPRIRLRALRDEDLATLESWGEARDALWGPYQRFQLDHLTTLRDAYRKGGLCRGIPGS